MDGPHGVPTRPIEGRQLDPDMIRLQRAAASAHQRGQRTEAARAVAAGLMALAGVTVTLVGHGRQVVALVGFCWFVVSVAVLRRFASADAKTGALIQEQFDTDLFFLPWRSTVAGDPIPDHKIAQLARKMATGSPADRRITDGWYDPTWGVHYPLDVLIAQQQNLAWDAQLRRRYAGWLAWGASAWTAGGLVFGFIANASVLQTLLSFYVPSIAAYALAADIWHGQREVANERERLGDQVAATLDAAAPGPISDRDRQRLRGIARDLQDGILRTRLNVSRVPGWLYAHYRDGDEADFAETAERHRQRLAGIASEDPGPADASV